MRRAVLLLAVGLAGCGTQVPRSDPRPAPKAETEPTAPGPPPPPKVEPAKPPESEKPPEPAPALDFNRFVETWAANQARAQKEYGGRRFRFSGFVSKVDGEGRVDVNLDANTPRGYEAQLLMAADDAAEVGRGKATFEAEFSSFDPTRFPAFTFSKAKLVSQP
jgi:hypothetical protein